MHTLYCKTTRNRSVLQERGVRRSLVVFVKNERPIARLTPSIEIDSEQYLLMTLQLAGIARSELGPAVGNVADQRGAVSALDLLITGV